MQQFDIDLQDGVRIGDAVIDCDTWALFTIEFDDGHEHVIEGFRPGLNTDRLGGFAAILGFINAWVESLDYPGSDNRDLFPETDTQLVDWAQAHADDIQIAAFELDELNSAT